MAAPSFVGIARVNVTLLGDLDVPFLGAVTIAPAGNLVTAVAAVPDSPAFALIPISDAPAVTFAPLPVSEG